jgi:hypothetical protein
MAVRIPDLEVTEDAVACTLSFNRSPHYCFVPWHAVYALVGEDGRGMVWPEDIPAEVAAQTRSLGGAMPGARLHALPSSGQRPDAERASKSLRSAPESIYPSAIDPESVGPGSVGPGSVGPGSVAPESVAPASGRLGTQSSSISGMRPEVQLDEVSEQTADGRGARGGGGDESLRPSERPYLRLVR